jgi:alginate export protein
VLASLAVRLASGAVLLGSLTWGVSAGAQVGPAAPGSVAVGDWTLVPVFDVRARAEYRHDVDAVDRAMLFERVRIGVDAQYDVLESRIVLQDARALDFDNGAFVGGPFPTAFTGAFEAWAQARARAARPTFVRVGRQPIVWGEGRLLGAADWSHAGRSLYAVRGRWSSGDEAVELLAAALEDSPPQGTLAPNFYGELFGARGEWFFDPLMAFEAYALARVAQVNPADPLANLGGSVKGETYTGSLRLHGDAQSWVWSAEGAYQLGQARAYAASRAAWALAAHVERGFELAPLRPTARLGLSYASGDSGGATYRAFDPILPDVHVWHGALDLFAWSNEEEASARVSVAPWIDAVATLEYRYARLAVPGGLWRSAYLVSLGAAAGNTSQDLGHEIDAQLSWSPWAPVDLVAGYSALILGTGGRAILAASHPGSVPDVSHLAYAQARVGF